MQGLVKCGSDDARAGALECIGNLAFSPGNANLLRATRGLHAWLARLAAPGVAGLKQRVRVTALRALAILGAGRIAW